MSSKDQQSVEKKIKETYGSIEEERAKNESQPEEQGEATTAESVESLGELLEKYEALSVSLEEEKKKAEDFQTKYLRAVADLENFRKRAVREKEELYRLALGNFAEEFFPVIDNFKLGMASAENHPEAKVVSEGFKMVYGQMLDVFKNHKIEEIDPAGQDFDPQFHESVAHEPHESIEENKVVQTVRVGYKINDRLLRAAAVTVSSGPPDTAENAEG